MENKEKVPLEKQSVHRILAHSYLVFFVLFLISVSLDLVFNLKFFNLSVSAPLGLIFLVFGTFLIFWAQKTSRHLNVTDVTKETFYRGPYRYTRGPTHWGLFFLFFGFGLMNNALFIVLFSVISFLITKFIFLKKEEEILGAKYGAPYAEYKKSVRI